MQVNLGYSYFSYDSYGFSPPSKYVSHSYDFGIAPFTRLYLDVAARGKFKVFGMAGVEFAMVKSSDMDTYGNEWRTVRNTDIMGSIGGGLAFFTKKDLSIDLSASIAGLRFGIYKTFGRVKPK